MSLDRTTNYILMIVVIQYIQKEEGSTMATGVGTRTPWEPGHPGSILGLGMLDCGYAWQHKLQMFIVGHFPIFPNSFTLQIV